MIKQSAFSIGRNHTSPFSSNIMITAQSCARDRQCIIAVKYPNIDWENPDDVRFTSNVLFALNRMF